MGSLVAALQAGVGKFAQRLIKEKADVRRRDFVGGDVVAQLGIALRMLGVPGQVFACKLSLDEFGIFGQEQNASLRDGPCRDAWQRCGSTANCSLCNFTAETATAHENEMP